MNDSHLPPYAGPREQGSAPDLAALSRGPESLLAPFIPPEYRSEFHARSGARPSDMRDAQDRFATPLNQSAIQEVYPGSDADNELPWIDAYSPDETHASEHAVPGAGAPIARNFNDDATAQNAPESIAASPDEPQSF